MNNGNSRTKGIFCPIPCAMVTAGQRQTLLSYPMNNGINRTKTNAFVLWTMVTAGSKQTILSYPTNNGNSKTKTLSFVLWTMVIYSKTKAILLSYPMSTGNSRTKTNYSVLSYEQWYQQDQDKLFCLMNDGNSKTKTNSFVLWTMVTVGTMKYFVLSHEQW